MYFDHARIKIWNGYCNSKFINLFLFSVLHAQYMQCFKIFSSYNSFILTPFNILHYCFVLSFKVFEIKGFLGSRKCTIGLLRKAFLNLKLICSHLKTRYYFSDWPESLITPHLIINTWYRNVVYINWHIAQILSTTLERCYLYWRYDTIYQTIYT
jgi:hypothetical protein